MTTYNEIVKRLRQKGINVSPGDSDETTAIVYDRNLKEVEKALEGLKFTLHPGYGGTVIVPKK